MKFRKERFEWKKDEIEIIKKRKNPTKEEDKKSNESISEFLNRLLLKIRS